MKPKISLVMVAVAVAAVATVNVRNLKNQSLENNLRLANIVALSDENGGNNGGNNGESDSEWGCGGNPTYLPNEALRPKDCQVWGANGTQLACISDSRKVCCNPADQTNCKPL